MKRNKFIVMIAAMLMAISLAGSISFLTNPTISPSSSERPDTTDDLTCSWTASGDMTTQNVSWYRNGALYLTESNTNTTSSILPSANTTRGQIWNCTVTLSNGTHTSVQSTNTSIKNADPSTINIYNSTGGTVTNTTSVIEDLANVFNLSSQDPDGDTVMFSAPYGLPGTSTLSSSGIFNWTPLYTDTSTNVTFLALDNYGTDPGSSLKIVYFQIQYVNDAPTFSPALSTKSILEGQTFNYNIAGSDEESNTPFTFSISSSPSLDLNITSTGASTALIMLQGNRTATYQEAGNYTVSVTIYDSGTPVANSTSSFTLQINQTNVAPVLQTIPAYNGTQGQPFSFTVRADDVDQNDSLNFTIVSLSCPLTIWNLTVTNSSSNATAVVNVTSLTNDHVYCRDIKITVIDDDGAEDYQDVFLNISNTNDPPIVGVLSYHNNSEGQQNISSLHAWAQTPFIYTVNATDIDSYTYESEVLTYYDNTSLFTIDSSTGLVSFTPSQAQIGNHTILINVTDDQGLEDTELMVLEIRNNTAPAFDAITQITCFEDVLCFYLFNATDADGDNVTFTSNSSLFTITDNLSQIPVQSGYVNVTLVQDYIGVYPVTFTATDTRGAYDTLQVIFTVNNTNDAPELSDFTFPTVVETHTVSINVQADDQDYDLDPTYEYVTFTDVNVSGTDLFTISTLLDSSTNHTYGKILFTPSLGTAGSYSYIITATDNMSAQDNLSKNFTVLAKSESPIIRQVTPWKLSTNTYFNLTNASLFNRTTSVNFTENRTVTYNISVTDDLTSPVNMQYTWYYDGNIVATTMNYTATYGYFSQGSHNITVFVEDDMYENTSFQWLATLSNVNRAPVLVNNLENITLNRTETFSNYLKNGPVTHFLDPDDDLDSDFEFDANETSTLTYQYNNCSIASLSVDGHSLRVQPTEIGTCSVYFVALDSDGLQVAANVILINATGVSNDTTQVPIPEPSSGGGGGGGGGGGSSSIITPTKKEELKPQAIRVIVPEVITTYSNDTALIPVIVQNTWNGTLKHIYLNASTGSPEVELYFDQSYFEELPINTKRNVTLYVKNYRLGEDYKINVSANVTDPLTFDEALVILNSIEQSKSGEDVQTKVTFAQDLLNNNPECLELNELLGKAKLLIAAGEESEASKLVDGVIEGCKYLVSVSRRQEQKPEEVLINKLLRPENSKYFTGLLIGIIGISLAVIGKRRLKKKVKSS